MPTTVTVKPGQRLLDIAIANAGSVEAVLAMAAAAGISVTDPLTAGQELPAPAAMLDGKVVAYYQAQGIEPASN